MKEYALRLFLLGFLGIPILCLFSIPIAIFMGFPWYSFALAIVGDIVVGLLLIVLFAIAYVTSWQELLEDVNFWISGGIGLLLFLVSAGVGYGIFLVSFPSLDRILKLPSEEAVAQARIVESAKSVSFLTEALKDEDRIVRQQAADALGKMKDPRAVEPLIQALKDENPNVRQCVA